MDILSSHPLDCHPPLALKLRSGVVLAHPGARWHVELLEQAGIPEGQWAEVVAESGFLDPQGAWGLRPRPGDCLLCPGWRGTLVT